MGLATRTRAAGSFGDDTSSFRGVLFIIMVILFVQPIHAVVHRFEEYFLDRADRLEVAVFVLLSRVNTALGRDNKSQVGCDYGYLDQLQYLLLKLFRPGSQIVLAGCWTSLPGLFQDGRRVAWVLTSESI